MHSDRTSGSDGCCLLCREKNWSLAVRSEDLEYHCKPGPFDLVGCTACGHVYLHPIPPPGEIASLYPPTYYTVNKKSPLYLQGGIYEKKLMADARRLRRWTSGVDMRSIVDIGCGELSRLVKLKQAFGGSVETIALDIQFAPETIEAAKAHEIQLVRGNVETDLTALKDNGHDLIIMRQLVEHLRDPRAALRGLFSKLSPHGLVIVDTPNRGGLDYRLFRKKCWGGYHIPRHFHIFTQDSLVGLMQECGFHIYRKGFLPGIGFWIVSLRTSLGLNSIEPGRSIFRFLYSNNLPLAAAFSLFDTLRIKCGFQTTNQFVIGQKQSEKPRA